MSVPILSAAKFVCHTAGWRLNNLQLQKILYILQMIYAGRCEGRRLLEEDFEAWDYGPVSHKLYDRVSCFGARPVKNIFHSVDDLDEDSDEAKFLAAGARALSEAAHWQLVRIVQGPKSAWGKYYDATDLQPIIPHAALVQEYRARGLDRPKPAALLLALANGEEAG